MRWVDAVVIAVLLSSCTAPASSMLASIPPKSPSPMPVATPYSVASQVLPPARSLPVVELCSQPLTTDQYGNSGPVLCTNGALNVLAWGYFAALAPRVMSAGPAASLISVERALCLDVTISHARVLDEVSAAGLATAYYGWAFNTDPTNVLYAMSTCPK